MERRYMDSASSKRNDSAFNNAPSRAHGSAIGGMTNGLGGRTNGLTNGMGGRTNGLTNGMGGRTNGLTNGLGGKTNGLTNGMGNGPGLQYRRLDDRAISPSRISLVIIIAFIIVVPASFFFLAYEEPVYTGFRVDGSFTDWEAAVLYSDPATNPVPGLDITACSAERGGTGDKAFIYVRAAGPLMATTNIDSVLAFMDSDGDASTGYSVEGIGADYAAEVYGWNGSMQGRQFGTFAGQDQANWSAWSWRGMPAAMSGAEMEIEIPGIAVPQNREHGIVLMTRRGGAISETCAAELSIGKGALVVEQVPADTGGIIAADHVMDLKLTARGKAVNVTSIQFTSSAAPAVAGLPVQVQADQTVTLQVSVPLTGLANGTLVTAKVSGVTCSGKARITGTGLAAYAHAAPSGIAIDGAFGDWHANVQGMVADADDAANPNIDVREHAAVNSTSDAFFYIRVDDSGAVLGGCEAPHALAKPRPSQGGQGNGTPGTPTPIPRVGGEDVARVYIDTVAGGQDVEGIGADYLIEITGKNGKVRSSGLYSLSPRVRIADVTAANHGPEMEMGVDLADIGFGGTLEYVIQTTDWSGEGDSIAPSAISVMARGTRAGGSGTSGDPYRIETLAELQAISSNPASYFILLNDIDASATSGWNSGAGFLPIGDSGVLTRFTGSFDGMGHKITGLFINRPTTDNVGLFGYLGTGAMVKDVSLIGNDITGAGSTGGLVGYNGGTVTQSCATGSVTGTSNYYVGGLVGWNAGTVSYSFTTGTVDSNSNNVGGLVGYNPGTVADSHSHAAVTASTGTGGLVGYNTGTVANSYATGLVTGTGGFPAYDGGLVGWSSGGSITNSFYDTQTTGKSDTGKGIPKTTAEMMTLATFLGAGWDIELVQYHTDEIWYIYQNHDYPRLYWEEKPLEIPEFNFLMLPILAMLGIALLARKKHKKSYREEPVEGAAVEDESGEADAEPEAEPVEPAESAEPDAEPEAPEEIPEEDEPADADVVEDEPADVEAEAEEPMNDDVPSEPPKIKHTLLIIGILMLAAGAAGVIGLRLGIVQAVLGDPDAYPGIGAAEPMGHIVSMVPFVLGLVTVAYWGVRSDPIYREIEKAKEEDAEEEEEGAEQPEGDEVPAEDAAPEEEALPDLGAPEPEPEAPAEDGPVVRKEKFEWEDEKLPEPTIAAKAAPGKDAEISAEAEELFDSIDELEKAVVEEKRQAKAVPATQKPAKMDEQADKARVERCQKMLSFARILEEDKRQLERMIGTGISVHDFTEEIRKAVDKRKRKDEEAARTAEQKASIIEEEVLDELLSLEDEVGQDDEDIEDMILSDLDELSKDISKDD